MYTHGDVHFFVYEPRVTFFCMCIFFSFACAQKPQANIAHAGSDSGIVAIQMKQVMLMQKIQLFLRIQKSATQRAYTKNTHSRVYTKK